MINLLLRADGGPGIGIGHLMRALALGEEAARSGDRVTLATAEAPKSVRRRFEDANVNVVELTPSDGTELEPEMRALLRGTNDRWVSLDGDQFTLEYHREVRGCGARLLVMDDEGELPRYHADLLLNQNVYAQELEYRVEPFTRLLLGTRFALLRREFGQASPLHQPPDSFQRLLVTMGGSDSRRQSPRVLEAIRQLPVEGLEITVLLGPATDPAVLQQATKTEGVCVLRDVERVADLMQGMDAAVVAAGSTCLELACLGIPMLVLATARNQVRVAQGLEAAGAAINLGWWEDLDTTNLTTALTRFIERPAVRAELATRARHLVDGQGAGRVRDALIRSTVRLRPATPSDGRRLWKWANEPTTRAASFSSEPIPWAAHLEWLERIIGGTGSRLFIVSDAGGSPVGQVRFDISGQEAEISIGLAPEARGRGYGARAIQYASERLFRETDVTRVIAHTKPENTPSIAAFERAGYRRSVGTTVGGQEAERLSLTRTQPQTCDVKR